MRHRYPTSPTLSTICAISIYALVQRFCQSHPLPRTRGRPPRYPEALILPLSLLRTRDRASFRRLLYAIAPEALPDHALPALGTLVYRLHQISDARWQQLLGWLAQQGLALEGRPAEAPYAFVDGTGVGYALPFHAQYRRGQQIRR